MNSTTVRNMTFTFTKKVLHKFYPLAYTSKTIENPTALSKSTHRGTGDIQRLRITPSPTPTLPTGVFFKREWESKAKRFISRRFQIRLVRTSIFFYRFKLIHFEFYWGLFVWYTYNRVISIRKFITRRHWEHALEIRNY